MANKSRRLMLPIIFTVLVIGILAFGGTRNASAGAAEQVIFSGVGVTQSGPFSPVGFWVWCIAEGNGPYAEHNVCAGAMYVYAQGITVGVHGWIEETDEGLYTMHLQSNKAGGLSATLNNPDEAVSGPNNEVDFSVTTGAGTSSGSSDSAVVRVTGP